jgi:hypothetical protein
MKRNPVNAAGYDPKPFSTFTRHRAHEVTAGLEVQRLRVITHDVLASL